MEIQCPECRRLIVPSIDNVLTHASTFGVDGLNVTVDVSIVVACVCGAELASMEVSPTIALVVR